MTKKNKEDGAQEQEDPLKRHYRYPKLEQVFARLDVGGNGAISFAEYLTTIDRLEPDEIQLARVAFDILGPDRNGNVHKRKFIALQIMAFEDVPDPEFDRYVYIMTKGSIIHRHTRKALLAAGVEIPEDFIDPPADTIVRKAFRAGGFLFDRAYKVVFARSVRRRIAVYELSANARAAHIRRIQKLKYKLESSDKTLLNEEDALAITALEEKAKIRGTQVPPMKRKVHRVEKSRESERDKRAKERGFEYSTEEKENDVKMIRGQKAGSEFPPLLVESSNIRLEAARAAHRRKRIKENEYFDDSRIEHDIIEEVKRPEEPKSAPILSLAFD